MENDKTNPSPEQLDAINNLIEKYNQIGRRPTPKEYQLEERALKLFKTSAKPKIKQIKNASLGYGADNLRLSKHFDAKKNLPLGWAVFPMYDSGGNYKLINAAQFLWMRIWNYWSNYYILPN